MALPTTSRPRVTVAVVSYNTRQLLQRCLDSLREPVSQGLAEVWVVDNGSSDGSASAAREYADWVQVIEPGGNLGFGRAVNLVWRQTNGEWLACANADVALEPGALNAMLAAGAEPQIGCVAPHLVLPDGSSQPSLHRFPTLGFTVAVNLGLYRLSRGIADRMLMPGRYDLGRPREPDWAVGAFLLLRRSALEEVGGFDERLWMYAEDLDLGWRLRRAGYRTRYVPEARVRHASGAAARREFGERVVDRFTAATYAVLVYRRGIVRAWGTAVVNIAGAAARVAWMAPAARVLPRLRGPLAENRAWLRAHRQGLRPRTRVLGSAYWL